MNTWDFPDLQQVMYFGGYNLILAAILGFGSWYILRVKGRRELITAPHLSSMVIRGVQLFLYALCTALSGLYSISLGQEPVLSGAVNLIAAASVFGGLTTGIVSSVSAVLFFPLPLVDVRVAGLGGLLLLPFIIWPVFHRKGHGAWQRHLWAAAASSMYHMLLNGSYFLDFSQGTIQVFRSLIILIPVNLFGYGLLYVFMRIPEVNSSLMETLTKREENYRQLLEHAPVSLWEEDFSVLAEYIRRNPRTFHLQNMENIIDNAWRYFSMISVLSTNRATLQLLGAENKEELVRRLPETSTHEFTHALAQEIIAVRDGKLFFMTGTRIRNFHGELLNVVLQWSVLPGYEKNYGRVLVSIIDITQTITQSRELMFANTQQEKLIGEVHHRVRNSLAIAYSIMGLELEEMDSSPLRELYISSMNRIQAIALIHTKLYKNKEILAMDLAEYLEDLKEILTTQTAETRIQCRLQCPSRMVHIDQVLPLGIILNELVINSQKHAFPDNQKNPRITIAVEFSGNTCAFRYSDNGRGMDPGVLERESTDSLGTSLLKSLSGQLGGELSYMYREGWSVFLLEFPLEEISAQEDLS